MRQSQGEGRSLVGGCRPRPDAKRGNHQHGQGNRHGQGQRQRMVSLGQFAEQGIGKRQAQVRQQHRRQESPPRQAVHSKQQHRRLGQHRHASPQHQKQRTQSIDERRSTPQVICPREPRHQSRPPLPRDGKAYDRAQSHADPGGGSTAPRTQLRAGQRAHQARRNRQEHVGRQEQNYRRGYNGPGRRIVAPGNQPGFDSLPEQDKRHDRDRQDDDHGKHRPKQVAHSRLNRGELVSRGMHNFYNQTTRRAAARRPVLMVLCQPEPSHRAEPPL